MHYNYIKKKYGDNDKLLFTDTDSLTYHIKTEDAYADFYRDKELFDNSDYPSDSPFYFNQNKKKIIGNSKTKLLVHLLLNSLVIKAKCIHIN